MCQNNIWTWQWSGRNSAMEGDQDAILADSIIFAKQNIKDIF